MLKENKLFTLLPRELKAGIKEIKLEKELITNYLHKFDYYVSDIQQINTKGATDCLYFIITLQNDQKIFFKAGEKVDQEVKNILNLTKKGVNVISPALRGSQENEKILITELLEHPNFGTEAVQQLHSGEINIVQFLSFQNKTFEALSQFYNIIQVQNDQKNYKSKMFVIRSQERLNSLLTEQHNLSIAGKFIDQTTDIRLNEILHTPIKYFKDNQIVDLPNIVEMHQHFKGGMERLSEVVLKVIHGDFHAPNIALDSNNAIRIIDISDVRYQEDPNWDLGKWLNYLKRFYRAAERRNMKNADSSIYFSIDKERINLKDFYQSKLNSGDLKKINDDAVGKFASIIDCDLNLVNLRSMAAEFVVNLSTLHRHLKGYPQTIKNVLSCLCESYLIFQKTLNASHCQTI
ncbi:MAG: hypothetical protein ABIH48_00010 [Candidatus Falkowbacteria bacterium]